MYTTKKDSPETFSAKSADCSGLSSLELLVKSRGIGMSEYPTLSMNLNERNGFCLFAGIHS